MDRLLRHFRREYQIIITERTAHRLAVTVRNMKGVDPSIQLGVTGSDEAALIPRRVDVTEARVVKSHSPGVVHAALELRVA